MNTNKTIKYIVKLKLNKNENIQINKINGNDILYLSLAF